MLRKLTLLLLPVAIVLGLVERAQAQQCSPPAITANTRNYNIFSPEQEMIVGELVNKRMSGDLRFVRDAQLQKYLENMGKRLEKHLPPTGLRFQYVIVDIPEANAFNIPGGYVFVSRKLISFANSEDELAGVVAHELGHAVVRHGASGLSELMKKILNVTQVGDRKDITEKYNLLMERGRTRNVSRSSDHESAQQLEADRIGLFAMVAAGYAPNAFASLFDRLVETKGKTGNWFSDIFGRVKPEQKRLREMIKITDQLPAECRDTRGNSASREFLSWQAEVVSFHETNRVEQLSGMLWKKRLEPGLRSDISHFAFSPDGSFFLAQDDFGITVVRREPLTVEFQIPITAAQEASFTSDGQFIVFGTESLRFEKWSVAEKKAVEIRELVIRRDCWEHKFSPDGKYLACVDLGLNLNVLETQTGKRVFEKKKFYELSFFEYFNWILRSRRLEEAGLGDTGFFRIVYSPDSRYVAVSRSEFFRYSIRVDGMVAAESENTLLALDLTTLKTVGAGGDMKKISRRPFVFLGSDRVFGSPSRKLEDAGVFSFPEGKRLGRFSFSAQTIKHTANPRYLIIKPLANAKLGIFDLSLNAIVSGFNKLDIAIWNNTMVFEGVNGRVFLGDLRYDEQKKLLEMSHSKTLEIPAASVDDLYVAEVSDNFDWLAVSSKTRGGLWKLSSGERKLFVRGFSGALVGNDGAAIGDFPKEAPVAHSLVFLSAVTGQVSVMRDLPARGARQYGRFVLVRESLEKPSSPRPESTSSDKSDPEDLTGTAEYSLSSNARMLLRDVINDKIVWSREFPQEVPRFFFDKFSGRLIFYWTLGSNAGKARLNQDPALAARAKSLGNTDDDYLLEVIDAFAAKTIGTMLLETGKGSFDILDAYSEGNWLLLNDSTNRVLAFSIKDGELQQRFFGSNAAVNPTKNQVAVQNYPGELTIYNLTNGDQESRLLFSGRIVFVRYSIDGKRLFVLTDQQSAYAFDVEKISRLEPAITTASAL